MASAAAKSNLSVVASVVQVPADGPEHRNERWAQFAFAVLDAILWVVIG